MFELSILHIIPCFETFEAPSEEELFRFMADVDEDGSLG